MPKKKKSTERQVVDSNGLVVGDLAGGGNSEIWFPEWMNTEWGLVRLLQGANEQFSTMMGSLEFIGHICAEGTFENESVRFSGNSIGAGGNVVGLLSSFPGDALDGSFAFVNLREIEVFSLTVQESFAIVSDLVGLPRTRFDGAVNGCSEITAGQRNVDYPLLYNKVADWPFVAPYSIEPGGKKKKKKD